MENRLCCLVNGRIRHDICNWKLCDKHWQKFLKTIRKMIMPLGKYCPKCKNNEFQVDDK